ncbi:hypothetical protein [Cobetia marina]|uniref:hypothetical protein n=1 Tax=Cobetia marina TaxID=28258 RepID=UPI003A921ADC
MSNEPFVLSSVERAQEWVSAFSKTFDKTPEESAAILATLCGFGSWDVMVFGIQSLRPSPCDEVVDEEEHKLRIHHYCGVLLNELGICPAALQAFITYMTPSTSEKYSAFDLAELDHGLCESIDDEVEDDDQEHGIEGFFGAPLAPNRAHAFAAHVGFLYRHEWMDFLCTLNWHIEESGSSDELFGEHSLEIYSQNPDDPMVPVYLAHAITPPEFEGGVSDFTSERLLQYACLGNFITNFAPCGSQDFLILGSRPLVKKINSKWFCYIGLAYNSSSKQWTALMLNSECMDMDIDTLLQVNRTTTSLNFGSTSPAENDLKFANHLVRTLSGFVPGEDIAEEWPIVGLPTYDGWTVLGAAQPGSLEPDQIRRHAFDESSIPGEEPEA